MGIYIGLALIVLGYFAGRFAESKHYQSIKQREENFLHSPKVSFGKNMDHSNVLRSEMVTGSAVISLDHFKRFLSGLQSLLGGRISSYESLLDRAKREAVLRMQEAAPDAHIILNVRIETTTIGNISGNNNGIGSVEAIAYGTAIWEK